MKYLVVAAVLSLSSLLARADCVESNITSGNNGIANPEGVGQSFVACETGVINSIRVWVRGGTQASQPTVAGEYNFYLAQDPGPGVPLTVPYQTVSIPGGVVEPAQAVDIVLDPPFAVTQGVLYRFQMDQYSATAELNYGYQLVVYFFYYTARSK